MQDKSKRRSGPQPRADSIPRDHEPFCECAACKKMRTFDLPDALKKAFFSGDVVLFAGAGISTEDPDILGHTFFDDIKKELGSGHDELSFPDLMSAFVKRPNGRVDLIRKLITRVQYIQSMPTLYREATQFHRELGPLFTVNTIITTNWDNFFERECNATPFTFSEDIAFWDAAERRVLKIHGTIENLSSIVATSEDYNLCHDRLSKI